ncbi:TPA: DUF1302 family protein, partial [Pseudomonas aeruginosa]|nr:DUF1302 family protein [Pseudomonas aeruginosa]
MFLRNRQCSWYALTSCFRLESGLKGFGFLSVLQLCLIGNAQAIEFRIFDNEVSGSLDTTLSYGTLWRVQGQDKSNNDINGNDGNRNFDTG